MGSFQFQVLFDQTKVNGSGVINVSMMLGANIGSSVILAANTFDNATGLANAAASDFGTPSSDPGEFGNGVLARLTFLGIAPGVTTLTLANLAVVAPDGTTSIPVTNVLNATVVVGGLCPDHDGDGISNAIDNCPAWYNPGQSLPPWTIPADDPDCDGFTTATELFVGTAPFAACPSTSTANDEAVDAWPPDFNDDQSVNIFDVNILGPAFFSTAPGPPYQARLDISPNNGIDIFDVNRLGQFFFLSCTP